MDHKTVIKTRNPKGTFVKLTAVSDGLTIKVWINNGSAGYGRIDLMDKKDIQKLKIVIDKHLGVN